MNTQCLFDMVRQFANLTKSSGQVLQELESYLVSLYISRIDFNPLPLSSVFG